MEFPATRFVRSNTVYKQLLKLREEVFEVQMAVNRLRMSEDEDDAYEVVMESLDAIQAAETLIRIVNREYPAIDVELAQQRVIQKNAERGYYD